DVGPNVYVGRTVALGRQHLAKPVILVHLTVGPDLLRADARPQRVVERESRVTAGNAAERDLPDRRTVRPLHFARRSSHDATVLPVLVLEHFRLRRRRYDGGRDDSHCPWGSLDEHRILPDL